ncbi:MAG: hypothetical protein ACI9OE_001546 [Mariniflexile sp.]|jgi:hypothetical protein
MCFQCLALYFIDGLSLSFIKFYNNQKEQKKGLRLIYTEKTKFRKHP